MASAASASAASQARADALTCHSSRRLDAKPSVGVGAPGRARHRWPGAGRRARGRRQEAAGLVPLNPVSPRSGQRLPLLATPPRTARASGLACITDRTAPAAPPTYRVAQTDWFGRSSEWTFVDAPAKARTAPPRPTPKVSYTPAAADGLEPAAGRLTVRVPIPADDALPPGCENLTALGLTAMSEHSSYALVATCPATNGAASDRLSTPGAGHAAHSAGHHAGADTGPARHHVRWPTAGGWRHGDGERHGLLVHALGRIGGIQRGQVEGRRHAARPAPGARSEPALHQQARCAGRAIFELPLPSPPAAGATYRVFYADEDQLLKGLRKLASTPRDDGTDRRAAEALADLEAAAGLVPRERAARFVAHAALYGWDMFQNLTAHPIDGPTFVDALPGSLQPLSFYRVITWSAANVAGDFSTSPLVPVAVLNAGPPPRDR